jgi:hypothetical protein
MLLILTSKKPNRKYLLRDQNFDSYSVRETKIGIKSLLDGGSCGHYPDFELSIQEEHGLRERLTINEVVSN